MKKLIIALSALGTLGVLASASFATDNTVWLCQGKEVTAPKTCLVKGEAEGAITMEDMKEEAAVECVATSEGYGEGWVGPGSEGEITSITYTEPSKNCKPTAKALNEAGEEVANKCEAVRGLEIVDLPWAALLELVADVNK